MKKSLCLILAVVLICVCGCNKQEKVKTLTFETPESICGKIALIPSSDTVLLQPESQEDIDAWDELVCIVVDDSSRYYTGDNLKVTFTKAEKPADKSEYVKIYADKITVYGVSAAKPIIYLYPEVPTLCSVKINLDGILTCTYPEHVENGWKDFTAYPDGTLIFEDSKEYYALYWESLQEDLWSFEQGFCVAGEDTAEFLEWALSEQGLSPREANEFIIYWLPLMQENPYNVIAFQTDTYTEDAVLEITPAPDSLLRVFMAYYPTTEKIDIAPQQFESFERVGFTVVEWGGSCAKAR